MQFLHQIPHDTDVTAEQLRDRLKGEYNLDQVRTGLNKLLKQGKLYLHYEGGRAYYCRKM